MGFAVDRTKTMRTPWSRSTGGRSLRHEQCTNTEWHWVVWPNLTDPEGALWRSQRGPFASNVLMAFPTSRSTRIEPQPLRVLLCRPLRTFLFPSPPAPADVAVSSTAVATIKQRARWRGLGNKGICIEAGSSTSVQRRKWSCVHEKTWSGTLKVGNPR